jgi:hypothetical protein
MVTGTRDAIDRAMDVDWNPTLTVFGQCSVEVWDCVLEKGQGKIPFDAVIHSADRRCTAIDIAIQPLPGAKFTNPTERGMIAESREWSQIVKPSLRALNIDLRAINQRYVRVELVPTGQKYTNSNGETKDRTTVKFVAVYGSEGECQAAADAFFASRGSADGTNGASATASASQPNGNGGNGSGANVKERETASKFLPALWNASGKDVTKFAQSLASNPLTGRHFTLDSPEVIALIQN